VTEASFSFFSLEAPAPTPASTPAAAAAKSAAAAAREQFKWPCFLRKKKGAALLHTR
jgi:hypothetical protein